MTVLCVSRLLHCGGSSSGGSKVLDNGVAWTFYTCICCLVLSPFHLLTSVKLVLVTSHNCMYPDIRAVVRNYIYSARVDVDNLKRNMELSGLLGDYRGKLN